MGKQRLTKGRMKARQRKMHLVARLFELPTSVGTACPSPPQHTLSSLRESRPRRGRASPSQSPRHSVDSSYRPIFSSSLRVPGAAAMVRREEGSTSQKRENVSRTNSPREEEEIMMEPIPRVEEQVAEVREAQEETCFEGPTWYVEEDEGEPSPRGAVHEV